LRFSEPVRRGGAVWLEGVGKDAVRNRSDMYIERALKSATELLAIANEADAQRDDDGCGIFFGVVRDCAYKILRQAEYERQAHSMRDE